MDFHCQVSLLEVNLPLFIQKPASSTFPLPRSKTAKKMRRNTWFSFPMARHPKKGGNWNIPEIDRTTKGTGCVLMCFASILWIPWGQCRNCCFKVEFLIWSKTCSRLGFQDIVSSLVIPSSHHLSIVFLPEKTPTSPSTMPGPCAAGTWIIMKAGVQSASSPDSWNILGSSFKKNSRAATNDETYDPAKNGAFLQGHVPAGW